MTAFEAAAQIARGSMTRSCWHRAVGFEDACWRPARTDNAALELLHEASLALGPGDSELRVRLLSGMTRAHALPGNYQRAAEVEVQAIAMARRLDDRAGLATVLMRSYWSHGNSSLERTLEMLAEARDLRPSSATPTCRPRRWSGASPV